MTNTFVAELLDKLSLNTLINIVIDNNDPLAVEELNKSTVKISHPEIGYILVKRDGNYVKISEYFNNEELTSESGPLEYNELHGPMKDNPRITFTVDKFYERFIIYVVGMGSIKAAIRKKLKDNSENKNENESVSHYFKNVVSDFMKTIVPDNINKNQFSDPFGVIGYINSLRTSVVPSEKMMQDAKEIADKVDELVKERNQIKEQLDKTTNCLSVLSYHLKIPYSEFHGVNTNSSVYMEALFARGVSKVDAALIAAKYSDQVAYNILAEYGIKTVRDIDELKISPEDKDILVLAFARNHKNS